MNYVPLIKQDAIEQVYTWTTGSVVGRFLGELKENTRIMGIRCPECRKVYVPPIKKCGVCYRDTDEWLEVGAGGKIISFTMVKIGPKLENISYPFICALIRLDNADTNLVHHLGEISYDKVSTGMRVVPVWRKERKGHILDIKYFKPDLNP